MTRTDRVELASGYSISRVINGCWQLTPDHGGGPGDESSILTAFAERFDAGFTTFDCADIYAGTEALLGKFRRSLPDPHAMQIHTKLVPDKATLDALTDADVDAIVERSRRQLGVEQLDLVQCHWWDYAVPGVERLCDRLCEAQQRGEIRLLGATNFDTAHVRRLRANGVPLVSLQAQYSLLDRRPEREMLAYGLECGIGLLAYGALAGGFLSAGYVGQDPPTTMNRSLQKYRLIIDEIGGWTSYQDLLRVLGDVARRHATTVDLVAARWVLDQPGVAAVILGLGSVSRAQHNRALFELMFDDEDRAQIAALLARTTRVSGDMYALERDPDGRHAQVIKTDLQHAVASS